MNPTGHRVNRLYGDQEERRTREARVSRGREDSGNCSPVTVIGGRVFWILSYSCVTDVCQ